MVACTLSGSKSERADRGKPQMRRDDREHPRAAAQVHELAAIRQRQQELQAQPRRVVRAGSEGLAGIDHYVDRSSRLDAPMEVAR